MEIVGAKGGSSSGSKSPARGTEIASVAFMKILIALGEGEILGGFDGNKIFLDGTPLISDNGTENFPGVSWEWRSGTQEQPYIPGFPSVENEIDISTELKAETPWVKAISNTQLSAVRIRMKFPNGVYSMRDDGVKDGYKIDFALDISTDGGAYVEYDTDSVDGIADSSYERSYRINLPAAKTGWQVRVRRLTANQTDGRHADTSQIASMTEIIDAKLRYPNTALLFVEFNSKLFDGRTPTITVLAKGRIIRVPSNYDPTTRTYSGVWDGQFKWAWTNNPAWIFYDLIVNPRFGLGNRLSQDQVDKWELYRIAQYCDQLVPDGVGGMEPRFLCDLCISSQADAWTVLMDLASIFRGMISWSNNLLTVVADMPEDLDPDFIFTRSNVINGSFNRAGTSEKAHYSTGLITFSNPKNSYQDDQAPVFDYPLVKRFGINPLEMTATGCTRETEAQRRGLWAIYSNVDDNAHEFQTGLEGQLPGIGKVVGIANNLYAGREISGRISEVSGSVVKVDRDVTVKAGDRLIVNLPTGKAEGRTVASIDGRKIRVTVPYSVQPEPEFAWAIDATDLAIQQMRVKKITSDGNNLFTISGIPYNPNKYERIDTGAIIEDRPTTIVPPRGQAMPSNIVITDTYTVNQGIGVTIMNVSWDAAVGAVAYEAQWRQNNGNWISVPRTGATNFSVQGIYAGRYQVRVRAVSPSDFFSIWANSAEVRLNGKEGAPPVPVGFAATAIVFGISLNWGFPVGAEDTQYTEIQYSQAADFSDPRLLTDAPYPLRTYTMPGLAAGREFWFRARLVDRIGNQGDWTAVIRGTSSSDASDILDYIGDQFMSTETGKKLTSRVDSVEDSVSELDKSVKAAEEAVQATNNHVDELNDHIDEVNADLQGKIDAATGGSETSIATIVSQVETLKTNDSAMSTKLDAVSAKTDKNTASIGTETTARTDADTALGKRIDVVNAATGDNKTAITSEVKARTDADTALGTRIDSIKTSTDKNTAAITSETTARTDADTALGTRIDSIKTSTDKNTAAITSETTARTDADTALGTRIDSIKTSTDKNTAAITSEATARTDADTALGTRIDSVKVATDSNTASIGTLQSAQSDVDSALAQLTKVTEASIENTLSNDKDATSQRAASGVIRARVIATEIAQADASMAFAQYQQTVDAQFGETNAVVQTTASAMADLQGSVSAQYSIKLGVNSNGQYYAAGMGIGIENTPSGMQTNVAFLADNFMVMSNVNGTPTTFFAITNGQTVIKEAFIAAASIGRGKITDTLQSDNYVAGQTGLLINFKTGTLETSGFTAGQGRSSFNNEGFKCWNENNILVVELGKFSS